MRRVYLDSIMNYSPSSKKMLNNSKIGKGKIKTIASNSIISLFSLVIVIERSSRA